jgi:hypothetical protein
MCQTFGNGGKGTYHFVVRIRIYCDASVDFYTPTNECITGYFVQYRKCDLA